MNKKHLISEQGFTLIELLVVIGIIGVLAGLGIQAFSVYESKAAHANALSSVRNGRTSIEAALNQPDIILSAVDNYTQSTQGPIADSAAAAYLAAFQLGPKLKLTTSYDPTCTSSSCQADFIEVKHCSGQEYAQWIRYGDGVDVLRENIAGVGCS